MTKSDLRIINFHGIGEPRRKLESGEEPYWISEKQFAEFMDDIAAERARVSITFDDGNMSDILIGAKCLEAHGMTATFFPLAGRLSEVGSLSQSDLRALLTNGHRIGTHGFHHTSWKQLDQTGVQKELIDARAKLEDCTGVKIDEAAIPFGRYGRATLKTLKSLGYRRVYSSDGGGFQGDPFPIPRWSVRGDTTRADVKDFLSGHETALKKVRRWIGKTKKQLI